MEDFLTFTGPVKLLIIERALIEGNKRSRREGTRKILTRLIVDTKGLPSSELRENTTVEYHYNEKKQLISIAEQEKTGTIRVKTSFLYDENGLLVKKEKRSADESLRELRIYRYDENQNCIFEKCGSRLFRFEYDNKNFLKEEYRYFGKAPELALHYSRDDEGNLREIITEDSQGRRIRQEQFKWEKGLLIEHFCLNKEDVILIDDLYEYSCFHDGNWLKRVRYSRMDVETREPVDVIYRSITYTDTYPELKPIHHNSDIILKEEKQALSFSDGSMYRGDLHKGKMEGKGFIQWPDGSSYKGDFKENRMEGRGILTWSNGDIYSGTFSRGKMEGIGRLRWHEGKTFYGLFEDDRRTNQGIIEEE